MPFPTVTVPAFPNVPRAPGVPQVARSPLTFGPRVTGALNGVLDVANNAFTGKLQGILTETSGRVTPILGTLRGVLDAQDNLSATLTAVSGRYGGRLVGTLAGSINRTTGIIAASLDSVVTEATGSINTLADLLGFGALRIAGQTERFVWGVYRSAAVTSHMNVTGARQAPTTANRGAVLTGDSVLAVDYRHDFRVSDYPVEQGAFQSYNKVETPYTFRITFTKSGTEAERTAFLDACERIVASVDLFDVATPEKTYVSANAVGMDYQRTAQSGVQLLTVDIMMQQIRATATTAFTSTKTDSGAGDTNTGAVQAVPPTPAQDVQIAASLPNVVASLEDI